MAQPSVAAFFSNRKRAAVDDATIIKNRVSVKQWTKRGQKCKHSNESQRYLCNSKCICPCVRVSVCVCARAASCGHFLLSKRRPFNLLFFCSVLPSPQKQLLHRA